MMPLWPCPSSRAAVAATKLVHHELAPVVEGRKGEHLHVFEELRASGFVRARIDGELVELDDLPQLDPHRRHQIEVVVDRFKVRADLALRLAESFESALRLSDGRARVAWLDASRPELVFSARFACCIRF